MKFSPPGFYPISLHHPSLFTFQDQPTLLEVSPRPSLLSPSSVPRQPHPCHGFYEPQMLMTYQRRIACPDFSNLLLHMIQRPLKYSMVEVELVMFALKSCPPPLYPVSGNGTTVHHANREPRTYPQYFPLNSHIQTTTSHSFYPLDLSNLPTSFHVYYILPSLSSVIFHLDYFTSLLIDLTGYTLDHFKQMIHVMQPVRSLWGGKSDYVVLLLQWLPLETTSNPYLWPIGLCTS